MLFGFSYATLVLLCTGPVLFWTRCNRRACPWTPTCLSYACREVILGSVLRTQPGWSGLVVLFSRWFLATFRHPPGRCFASTWYLDGVGCRWSVFGRFSGSLSWSLGFSCFVFRLWMPSVTVMDEALRLRELVVRAVCTKGYEQLHQLLRLLAVLNPTEEVCEIGPGGWFEEPRPSRDQGLGKAHGPRQPLVSWCLGPR